MKTVALVGYVAAIALAACQHRVVPPKAVRLAQTHSAEETANPLIQKWVLPSGSTATLRIRWKPFPPPDGNPTEYGAITAMELSTPGSTCVLPKYSFEQLWAPSLRGIRMASLDGSDSNLLMFIDCGDGGETPVAEFHVQNGELKSAWPIDMSGMSDIFPATEPTPNGIRKRVTVNFP